MYVYITLCGVRGWRYVKKNAIIKTTKNYLLSACPFTQIFSLSLFFNTSVDGMKRGFGFILPKIFSFESRKIKITNIQNE